MVIKKIKEAIENRRQKKAEKIIEKERLENFRENEDLIRAEQVKKEADRLAHLKQYKTSIDEYKRALEIYSFNEKELAFKKPAEFFFKIYYNMAASYSFLNKYNDSIEFFDKALKIDNIDEENNVKALMSKGNCYYRAKQLIKEDFEEGAYKIRINSDFDIDEKTLENLKKLDVKENLIGLAHDCFTKAAEIDRNNTDSWYKKGHMEFLMDLVKEAMLSFDNVLMIQKNYDNTENIELFDDIKREKGIKVKHSRVLDSELKFKTKTGHLVKNKTEKMIANFLFDSNLMFQYNFAVSWADKDNFRPSFFVPKLDLYIEHYPYDYIKEYQKTMKGKIKQFDKHKKKHIYITSEDENNLEESIKLKMKPYIIL